MSTITTVISLQPGQPGEGMEYNPLKSLPYPIHVSFGNQCTNVFGPNDDVLLLGFSASATSPRNMIFADDWREGDLEAAIGMYPVFVDEDGGFVGLAVPIVGVVAR